MVPIAITGFLGYDFFKKNFAHVHGIIMYSDNKDEADTILENNKKYIDKNFTVEGKYSPKSDVLVLNTQAANKLINEKVFNNVTKKGDKFKFKTVENLSAEPALWTGKEDKTITDDKGQSVKPKSTKYIVLGEYSATSKLLILNDEDYQKFDAKAKFVSVIKEKRDADKVLKSYITSGSIPSQIFPYK
jgi:hypothetical protein